MDRIRLLVIAPCPSKFDNAYCVFRTRTNLKLCIMLPIANAGDLRAHPDVFEGGIESLCCPDERYCSHPAPMCRSARNCDERIGLVDPHEFVRALSDILFGQKNGTVPKLFANPVLTQVKKPKLGNGTQKASLLRTVWWSIDFFPVPSASPTYWCD